MQGYALTHSHVHGDVRACTRTHTLTHIYARIRPHKHNTHTHIYPCLYARTRPRKKILIQFIALRVLKLSCSQIGNRERSIV